MKIEERYDIVRDTVQWFFVIDTWEDDQTVFEGTFEDCKREMSRLASAEKQRAEDVLYILHQLTQALRKVY